MPRAEPRHLLPPPRSAAVWQRRASRWPSRGRSARAVPRAAGAVEPRPQPHRASATSASSSTGISSRASRCGRCCAASASPTSARGAGLPGLPLAITEPERAFTLIESRAKRVRFLRQVIGELGLANTSVAHGRAEHLRPESAVCYRACPRSSAAGRAARDLPAADGARAASCCC